MKFDMGQAWNDATAMIAANKDVLPIIAGVFFFLPALALSVLAPGTELEAAAGDPERMQAAVMAYFSNNWWIFIIYAVASWIGTLALLALMGRNEKLTVGEAISLGVKGLVPYFAASVLMGMGIGILAALVGVIAGVTGSPIVGTALGILLIAAAIIVIIRMVLVGPVIAIEGVMNPVAAIVRSWSLVKGSTRYVFAFLLLLFVALIVVSLVLGLIFGLIGAMVGAAASIWVEGILGGILGAIVTVLLISVYAAIYRQLAGGVTPSEIETFE